MAGTAQQRLLQVAVETQTFIYSSIGFVFGPGILAVSFWAEEIEPWVAKV